jgi:deoxycytidylate deaminase
MEYDKPFTELQVKLKPLQFDGKAWERISDSEHRLRQPQGVSILYNESKKQVYVCGNPRATKRAHVKLKALLNGASNTSAAATPNPASADTPNSNPSGVTYLPIDTAGTGLVINTKPMQKEYSTDVDSEIVFGIVATVGTDTNEVARLLTERLKLFDYTTEEIKLSRDILEKFVDVKHASSFDRINALMDKGNELRESTNDYAILAKAAAGIISQKRQEAIDGTKPPAPFRRKAFIISSLKHPDEAQALRKIYSNGFFLLGVHADKLRRVEYLKEKDMLLEQAQKLIARDEYESPDHGQHTRDTFHLSDFFIDYDGDADKYSNEIKRIINLVFADPFVTPTFDEFAMFMAFSASLRSADLSRQVGAVVTQRNAILSTGANDVPKAGGGLYWPERSDDGKKIVDSEQGRDFMLGYDANVREKQEIIADIVAKFPEEQQEAAKKILKESKLKDITEYGRVAHAEMEALLACSRHGIPTVDTDLYCTTFPCHNCAKHIIAAGVKRVVYVEPYPKSKALEHHKDSITFDKKKTDRKVLFEPFVGVGPRVFFNLFSTSLGSGSKIKRKNDDGYKITWSEKEAKIRMQMLPSSYIEREAVAGIEAKQKMESAHGSEN